MLTAPHLTTDSQLALASCLVGRPWAANACGPSAFNCWGLVRYWMAEAEGIQMGDVAVAVDEALAAAQPSAGQVAAIAAAARAGGWRPRSPGASAQAGDILLLDHAETGLRHVGVVLWMDGLLHLLHCEGSPTQPAPGVVMELLAQALERYTRPEPWGRAT